MKSANKPVLLARARVQAGIKNPSRAGSNWTEFGGYRLAIARSIAPGWPPINSISSERPISY